MTAWEVLLRCGIGTLPVDLRQICSRLGIGLYSYTQGYRILQMLNLGKYPRGADGFLFREEDGTLAIIFYNPHQTPGRQCFTIAHEIGHYALGHCEAGDNTAHRAKDNPDSPEERAADRFAAQLLAPACVLRGMGLSTSFAIGQVCGLSIRASEVRAARMQRLLALDAQWMAERGRSYFFRSPTEWKLYQQFEPFIRAYNSSSDLYGRASSILRTASI